MRMNKKWNVLIPSHRSVCILLAFSTANTSYIIYKVLDIDTQLCNLKQFTSTDRSILCITMLPKLLFCVVRR